MSKFSKITLNILILVIGICLNQSGCKRAEKPETQLQLKAVNIPPQLGEFILAFTSGEISKTGSIYIQFAKSIDKSINIDELLETSPINFEPEIRGTASWKNKYTLEFKPQAFLKPGQIYTANLKLVELFDNVPENLTNFQFQFYTPPTILDLQTGELKALNYQNLELQKLEGKITSSDFQESNLIERVLEAEQEGKKLNIKWVHIEDGKTHNFVVENIGRKKETSEFTLKWNASFMNIDFKGNKKFPVYPLQAFKFLKARAETEPERYVLLYFSDPIKEDQDLTGLIRLKEENLKFAIDGNLIKVYPESTPSQLAGNVSIYVEPGIKNIIGDKIQSRNEVKLSFKDVNPQLELLGKGTIIPTSKDILFPFKAINLKAVDIQITKIFENNIHQFFQINEITGTNELYRVGKVVLRKKVELKSAQKFDHRKWNQYFVDLSELINLESGAIYQITLGFRKSYSLYPCAESTQEEEASSLEEPQEEGESSFWDSYEEGYYDYDDYYYSRNDPCKEAYYRNRVVSRNVLVSDLGLIAKMGLDSSMILAVTDLKTTKPVSGATLEVYDFQRQLMIDTKTDLNGIAQFKFTDKPFLLVAKYENQRGYLKFIDGHSLSLSRFDVSGTKLYKGLRGYLYGERGVWRPGDTMYLTFILEDREKVLPENHPVSLELFNPRGQLVKRVVRKENLNGFYSFPIETSPDAPTGDYSAKIQVGGAVFEQTIKIETIIPNRLKINFDIGKEYLSIFDKDIKGKLAVTWLHGAVARNLETDIQATLVPVKTQFNKYADFIFDDPSRRYFPHTDVIFESNIDNNGMANFPIRLTSNENAPGQLKANIVCKVMEPGGTFSVDKFSVPYHPYKVYVGIKTPKGDKVRGMLLTDQNHKVEIVTINADGNPVSRNRVQVSLYKLSWKWWWDKAEDDINYNSGFLKTPIASGVINTDKNGEGSWTLRVNYPDWGRYLVRACDENGHCSGKIVYIDWPGWAGRPQAEQPGGASMLNFTSDKTNYIVGEKITLSIPTGQEGRAFISLESGSKVLDTYWVEAVKGMTNFTFEATPEMAPNIYANVTLLQPHAQTANDLPIRLYGVIPINIENPKTHLQPEIDMPDVLQPEEEVLIKVSEKEGRQMTYTLAIVDEGLLDLTRFKTPNPWEHFFSREALNIKTWDMYDQVVGAYGSKLEVLLSLGGDEGAQEPEASKMNRFKPVVIFLGPFDLKGKETKSHKIKMPLYVGSVKTMVVAGYKGAYGASDKITPVRKPLMLLGTLPRVLGPNEDVEFSLSVFAMQDDIKNVEIDIKTNEFLSISGISHQTITFEQTGDKLVSFPLRVQPNLGKAKIYATAKSGKEKAEYNFEVDIRSPNPPITNVITKVINPEETLEYDIQPVGIAGTNSGTVEISSIPPLNLAKHLEFLIRYPHGCIEQTTSAVFPQLYLSDLIQLPESRKKEIEKYIHIGIAKISSFQLPNGGLGYWPGQAGADEWATNYAGHFMFEAQQKGYVLPADFLDNWISYQKKRANEWLRENHQSELMQAYRLYLLALANESELGAMNRFRETYYTNVVARWLLASAYYMAGQNEIALQMARSLTLDVEPYQELSYTYGSATRDKAIILQAMNVMNQQDNANALVEAISNELGQDKWLSTQTAGYCLLSMAKHFGKLENKLNFSYRTNGEKWQDVKLDASIEQIDLAIKDNKMNKFIIKNNTKQRIFMKTVLKGIPEVGDETDASNDVILNINYEDLNGNRIDPTSISQGTDFYAEVSVQNPGNKGDYKEMALTQIFPSGWEIHNIRTTTEENGGSDKPTYQDIRDDRVYTYFNLKTREKKVFRIMLNASYLGRFYLPTIQVEAMYNAEINAHKRGMWVEVVKPR